MIFFLTIFIHPFSKSRVLCWTVLDGFRVWEWPPIIDDGGVSCRREGHMSVWFQQVWDAVGGDPGNKIWILSHQLDPESAAITAPLDDFSLLAGAIERSWIARLWGDRSEQNWWRIHAPRLNPSHACSPRAHPSSSSSSSSCWCDEHDVPCLQQNHDRDLRTHHDPKPRHGL